MIPGATRTAHAETGTRFAALASAMVGRSVETAAGDVGTVVRVTTVGLTVDTTAGRRLHGLRAADITRWLEPPAI